MSIEDPTLADTTLPATPSRAPTDPGRAAPTGGELEARYRVGDLLGRGGMGEVRDAHDARIDRDVAIKRMRSELRNDDAIARFLREARVQGRLDHPAVVPVHDLGVDADGNPYFVMKRLAGTTLADVLAKSASDPATREAWPRRVLLARFIEVCLANEFAHTRGVVHRDLKPANIMLGDFGEVYVLDWGLARVLGDSLTPAPPPNMPPLGNADAGKTEVGALLGTPGYMAPEQVRGETAGTRADVFALGCILYEIVTLHPAIPRNVDAFQATLDAACHRPSERHPELAIPPELDDACASATDGDPARRPTARELASAVQHYLDGRLDELRRAELARTHATRARDAVTGGGAQSRATAMLEAGRALALDANNADAQEVLAHLMLEAPREVPAEAVAAADAERGLARRSVLRWIWKGYAGVAALMGLLLAFPIHHLAPIVALVALTVTCAVVAWRASRRPLPMQAPVFTAAIWLNAATLSCACLVFGPLLIVPIYLIMSLAGMLSLPTSYPARAIVVPHALSLALPLTLEWSGVLPSSYEIAHGLVLTPPAIDLSHALTVALVVVSVVAGSIVISIQALAHRAAQRLAQDALHAQRWHLQQLLPHESPAPE